MTEAPSFAPVKKVGLTPKPLRPNYAKIPHELINPTPELSERRCSFTEKRVKKLIEEQSEIVEKVIINKQNDSEDIQGHDITVILGNNSPEKIIYDNKMEGKDRVVLKNESPIQTIYVQVKSRKEAITAYKRRIREKYIPDSNGKTETEKDEMVKRWLTEHGIILINGSQTKTDKEILEESFYPQLQRIQKDTKRRQNTNTSSQMNLFTDNTLTQFFPSYVTDEKLSLREHPFDNFKAQPKGRQIEEGIHTENYSPIPMFPVIAAGEQLALRPFS